MKTIELTTRLIFSLLAVLSSLHGQQAIPSDAEADQIIAQEMAAREARKEVQPDFTILETYTRVNGSQQVVFHKVAPPALKKAAPALTPNRVTDELVLSRMPTDSREQRSLSLGIQIYDNEVSELVWRKDGQCIRAYSNIDFSYLTPVGQIESENVVFSLFAITSQTTRERESARLNRMREAGIDVEPLFIPELSDFTGPDPEYIIYADEEEIIPEELFETLDALHAYYVEHESDLKAEALKRKALSEARERYKEANTRTKEPTVIHYWKVENPESEDN